MKLLLFGNPSLEIDNLAVKIGNALEKEGFAVEHLENPLSLLDINLSDCVILDVAEGINDVKMIDNVDRLVLGRLCSLHDFDMAYFLKLMKQLGKLDKIRIVAIPMGIYEESALNDVRRLLHNL